MAGNDTKIVKRIS